VGLGKESDTGNRAVTATNQDHVTCVTETDRILGIDILPAAVRLWKCSEFEN
jgi:hypothetical protein